jgi:hypothetical protein
LEPAHGIVSAMFPTRLPPDVSTLPMFETILASRFREILDCACFPPVRFPDSAKSRRGAPSSCATRARRVCPEMSRLAGSPPGRLLQTRPQFETEKGRVFQTRPSLNGETGRLFQTRPSLNGEKWRLFQSRPSLTARPRARQGFEAAEALSLPGLDPGSFSLFLGRGRRCPRDIVPDLGATPDFRGGRMKALQNN